MAKHDLCKDPHLPERFDEPKPGTQAHIAWEGRMTDHLADVLHRSKTGDITEREFELLIGYSQMPKH